MDQGDRYVLLRLNWQNTSRPPAAYYQQPTILHGECEWRDCGYLRHANSRSALHTTNHWPHYVLLRDQIPLHTTNNQPYSMDQNDHHSTFRDQMTDHFEIRSCCIPPPLTNHTTWKENCHSTVQGIKSCSINQPSIFHGLYIIVREKNWKNTLKPPASYHTTTTTTTNHTPWNRMTTVLF